MEQLCRVLAKDLGARNITVNTISPGPVDTPLFREGKTEQQIQFIAGLNPSKRLGLPDDIAPVVSFLASPAASWVNGQNIMVNGVRIHQVPQELELILWYIGICGIADFFVFVYCTCCPSLLYERKNIMI